MDEYKILPLKQKDVKSCIQLLTAQYINKSNPLTMNIKNINTFKSIINGYINECLILKCSYICVDNDTNKIVGCILTKDYCHLPDPNIFNNISDNYKIMYALLEKLDIKFVDKYPELLKDNIVLEFCYYAVDDKYTCYTQEISKKLKNKVIKDAKLKGYQYILDKSIKNNNIKQNINLGFNQITTVFYKNFEYPINAGKYPIKSIPSNDKASLMLKKL